MAYRNYSVANGFIVSKDGTGDFTTIAAALTAATSGKTIFIKPGIYTENPTLVAGVNLVAFDADALTPNVVINGKCTFTAAGTVSISGIQLRTNSDFALAITGSAASIVNLTNCYINALNNTAISYTSSSASSQLIMNNCFGNLATTGIAIFSASTAGVLFASYCTFINTGSSTVSNTCASTGSYTLNYFNCNNPITTSNTAAFSGNYLSVVCSSINTTAFTHNSTLGLGGLRSSQLLSGTATALVVGASAVITLCTVELDSTNAATISNAGTVQYSFLQAGTTTALTLGGVGTYTKLATQPSIPVITTTQFDVLVGGAGNTIGSVGPGSANQVLQSGGNAANPAYSTATYPATTTINQILYSSAANTITGLATADNGVLITSAAGVPSILADGTTGQVLTATTGSPPAWATPPAAGTFVQQTRASNGTASSTSSSYAFGATPSTSGGVQILSVSITPKNSANILLIEYTYWGGVIRNMASGASIAVISALFNGGANAVYSQCDYEYVNTAGSTFEAEQAFSATGRYFVAAGGTSSITFTVRIGPTAGSGATAYFLQDPAGNTLNGTQLGIITVTEYSA